MYIKIVSFPAIVSLQLLMIINRQELADHYDKSSADIEEFEYEPEILRNVHLQALKNQQPFRRDDLPFDD